MHHPHSVRALGRGSIGVALCGLAVFFAGVLPARAEIVRSFDALVEVRTDGSILVTETIAYDFADASRHGMFRTLPREHVQDASRWYRERYIDLAVRSVAIDGAPVPYATDVSGDTFTVRIGDADQTVTGLHTYTLTYEAHGALFYTDDATELYWNVVGSAWEVPIESVTARLVAPPAALGDASTCYVGFAESTERCTASTTETGAVFTARALEPGEGMTIAHELDPRAVERMVLERVPAQWVLVPGAVLFFGLLIAAAYRIRTKHRTGAPIIAQYEPYAGVRPMYAGVLIDGVLNPRDITAGIVYLAEQGFLTIRKTSRTFLFFDISDYEVELLKDGARTPGAFLARVLELLYGSNPTRGQVVSLSDIKKSLPQQKLNQKILSELRRALKRDLQAEGFFERSFSGIPAVRTLITGVVVLVVLGVLAAAAGAAYLGALLGALIALSVTASIVWTRRTRKGYEARNHLMGFKTFLSVTGTERFAFHNAPDTNPETFLAYLPYAIAFGVERAWAEVFRDVTIPNPGWYDGGSTAGFSAAAFTSDLSTFSSSLANSTGATPASGGGAAGGGAGGGGGGSW